MTYRFWLLVCLFFLFFFPLEDYNLDCSIYVFFLYSIDPGNGEIVINFDDMKATTSFGDVHLRRLSTKSAVLPTDHALSTQWIWYWQDETKSWNEYGSEPMVCWGWHEGVVLVLGKLYLTLQYCGLRRLNSW